MFNLIKPTTIYCVLAGEEGHGSQVNPYVISTATDWEKMSKLCGTSGGGANKYYVLANDIDFTGEAFYPIAVFNGTFYGMGHILKNISVGNSGWVYWNGSSFTNIVSATTKNGLGVFCLSNNATITDLKVENFEFSEFPTIHTGYPDNTSGPYIGGIVGVSYNSNATILNCATIGSIHSSKNYNSYVYMGGILGYVYNGSATIYRCMSDITTNTKNVANSSLSSPELVQSINGGICASTGTKGIVKIYECFANLVATNSTPKRTTASSVFGWKYSGSDSNATLENCVGFVDLTIPTTVKNVGGALVGTGSSHITLKNCFASGKSGTETNKLSMPTIGLMTTSIVVNSSSTYNVKETTSYAPQYWDATETNSSNTKTSVDNLLAVAESVFGGNSIWDTNSLSSFDIVNNPVNSSDIQKTIVSTSLTTTYNGEMVDLEEFFPGITVERDESDKGIDAGTYVFTVTLNNDDLVFYNTPETTRTSLVTINIKKAPLSITQLQVDEYGKLVGIGESQSVSDFLSLSVSGTIYPHDSDPAYGHTPPEFILEYQKPSGSWSETLPTTAGTWYVRANIKNAESSNYTLTSDGQTAFNRAKDRVSLPYFYNDDSNIKISNSTTTVFYSGSSQVFSLVNDGVNKTLSGISVIDSSRTPGLLYSQSTGEYSVSSFGTYTIDVKLADTANNQWADSSTDTTKTITLIVKPADLTVSIDEASKTSWAKGERGFKILMYVDGVKGNDAVKFDVTYGKVGGSEVLYVPENNINIDPNKESRIIVSVDTTNIPIGVQYFLNIALKNGIAINSNYNLVNDMGSWNFLLTNSSISKEDITAVWSYSNIILGTANFDNQANGQVTYNEYEYKVELNPTLLHSGVNVTYSGRTTETNSNNSQVYTITAVLSPKDGYTFESNVQTTYSFSWTITPIECDLSKLIWAQDFDYDGSNKTMTILNLPNWLTNTTLYTNNMAIGAGDYTATCNVGLTQYGNHTFTNSGNSQEVSIASNGRSATITHNWKINKAVIQVSNFADLWIVKTIKNKNGDPIDLRIPTAMNTYANQLVLKYYTDSNCNTEIDPVDMELKKEQEGTTTSTTIYYAKVWLNDDAQLNYGANYRIKNVSDDSKDYAILQFNIGGIRAIIRLTVDTSLVYNGQVQSVNITSNNADYNNLVTQNKAGYEVKYYEVTDISGNYDSSVEVNPKHVGKYVAVIFVKDLDEGDENKIVSEFVVYNHAHYFEIAQLELTTNWSFVANGNTAIPNENVTANANVNVTDFYNYTIYDSTGTNIILKEDLSFNTRYIARLSLKDTSTNASGLANVVLLSNDDVTFTNTTEYAFTTGQNPDAPAVVLDNPEIFGVTNVVYDKTPHNIVVKIRDNITNKYVTDILSYVTIELKNNSGITPLAETDIMSQTNAGTYTYVIKIKTGANASWLWGNATDEKEVTFTIDKKPIFAPNLKTEYEWNGNSINIWTDDASWLDWVEYNGTYSSTELGTNTIKFTLKDNINTYWDDRTLIDSNKQNDEINLTWSIVKVKIAGEWKENSNGYIEFIVENEAQKEFIETKYVDINGNEVKPENFVEGEKYTAVVSVKDSDHYELSNGNKVDKELNNQFEYKKPLGFIEKVGNFIKANWLWFIIGLVCVLLLIIILIIAKRRKKKKEETLKAQEDNKNEKLEKEKEELQKKLDEANSKNNTPYPTMPYPMPPYYPPMPPQYPNNYDSNLIKEIEELREQVKSLTKFNLASEEEKFKDSRLARVENMLMQFLMNNFANKPNWVPFNNQDMVNYNIDDLMKIYAKAKELVSNNIAENKTKKQQQILLDEEAEGFENKVLEYNKQKADSQYIELLKELRDRISKVEEKVEEDRKERTASELEKTKNELAKSQADLEKKQNEIENLKEQNKQHENQKLLDELSKKNDRQDITIISPERLEFNEAFNLLSEQQKTYFNILRNYALQKPQARVKLNKYNLSVGVGNSSYIKFVIKRNILFAYFGTTEIKLEDNNSVENAKHQIDAISEEIKKIRDK